MTHQHQHFTSSSSTLTGKDGMIIIPLYHQTIGIFVFILCMTSYRIATQSSPGIIANPSSVSTYNHYPYDGYMYDPPSPPPPSSTEVPTPSTNTTTNHPNNHPSNHHHHHHPSNSPLKVARSKYDRMKYHHYIPKYDHYCYWMNNTFGEENYRYFIFFLFVHVTMCCYGWIIIGILFYNDIYIIHQLHLRTFINTSTQTEVPVTTYILFQYVISVYMYEMAVFLVLIVMSIALFLFLGYHIYITTFTGLTSHEMYKWSQVQKWYRTECQLYHQQQKQQRETSLSRTNHDRKRSNSSTTDEQQIEHPGPKPINIYHYGMIQNWKHVFYPISIRKRRRRSYQQQVQEPQRPAPPSRPTSSIVDQSRKES
jgi:palmitoyltransferase